MVALQFKKHSASLKLSDHLDLGFRIDVVSLETDSLDPLVVLHKYAEMVERAAAEIIIAEVEHLYIGIQEGLAK
jgi:hypothetical protein